MKNSSRARFRPRSSTKHTGFGAFQVRSLVAISSTPAFSTGWDVLRSPYPRIRLVSGISNRSRDVHAVSRTGLLHPPHLQAVIAVHGPAAESPGLRRGDAGQVLPFSAASMSRATAAVQDCSVEPRASPVNGSKYSAKPPSASPSRVSRRRLAALSYSPVRSNDHHRSQFATGQTGPLQ